MKVGSWKFVSIWIIFLNTVTLNEDGTEIPEYKNQKGEINGLLKKSPWNYVMKVLAWFLVILGMCPGAHFVSKQPVIYVCIFGPFMWAVHTFGTFYYYCPLPIHCRELRYQLIMWVRTHPPLLDIFFCRTVSSLIWVGIEGQPHPSLLDLMVLHFVRPCHPCTLVSAHDVFFIIAFFFPLILSVFWACHHLCMFHCIASRPKGLLGRGCEQGLCRSCIREKQHMTVFPKSGNSAIGVCSHWFVWSYVG